LLRRQAALESHITDLERQIANFDSPAPISRVDPVTYLNPYEGQRAVDPADEQHMWYSNGQWRKAGGLTIPFFRAYRWNAATQSNPNTQDIYIQFDRYQTSDSSKIDSDGWQAGTPDFFNRINLKVHGLYSFSIMFDFSNPSPFTGNFGVALEGATSEFYPAPFHQFTASERAGDNSSGMWAWSFIQSFPPIWYNDSGGGNSDLATSPMPKNLRWTFANNSGGTIGFLDCMTEIHLLYEYDYGAAAGTIQHQA
jgi:hypothetical protein